MSTLIDKGTDTPDTEQDGFRGLVVPSQGPITEVMVPKEDALELLQGLVGGNIQAIPLPNFVGDGDKATAYINEEGLFLLDCKPNMRATDFFVPGVGIEYGSVLMGTCVFVGFHPASGEHRDLPPLTEKRIRLIEEEAGY